MTGDKRWETHIPVPHDISKLKLRLDTIITHLSCRQESHGYIYTHYNIKSHLRPAYPSSKKIQSFTGQGKHRVLNKVPRTNKNKWEKSLW